MIIKLHSHDQLQKCSDGSFIYLSSYGEEIEFMSSESLYCWLSENQIDLTVDIEKFIEE
jgi:hypothetical protein